jgi:hypothetical protein
VRIGIVSLTLRQSLNPQAMFPKLLYLASVLDLKPPEGECTRSVTETPASIHALYISRLHEMCVEMMLGLKPNSSTVMR